LHQSLIFCGVQNALANQVSRIQIPGRFLLANLLVHQRLGNCWFIRFVVAPTAVANKIYHYILVKVIAKINCHLGYKQDRLRIIGINVKNRRLHHFGHVGAVFGRAGVLAQVGGKSNLVIENDMHRTTGLIGAGL